MSKTLWHSLMNTVTKYGYRPIFHLNNKEVITYNSFLQTTNKYRSLLQKHGVGKGDRVVVIGENSPNWASLSYAIYSMNATLVPTFKDQQDHIKKHILNETKPKIVFNATLASVNKLYDSDMHHLEINHETVVIDNPRTSHSEPVIDSSIPAMILYTSGTTSTPKGVPLTHDNVMSNIGSIDRFIGESPNDIVTEADKYVSFLPWNHCYGINCELNYMISIGASMHINRRLEHLGQDIRTHNPTILCTVPRFFQLMHKKISNVDYFPRFVKGYAKQYLFGKNIRYVTSGGSAISQDLLKFYDRLGLRIYQGYGSTECSPMISLSCYNHNKIGSVGKVLDCNEVLIQNNSQDLHGEILVSGSNVTSGYYNCDPDLSFEYIDGKKMYKTGDLGSLDKDGFLYVTGRLKEPYKLSNGKFVNPVEIEQILLQIPEIIQVVVFGNNCVHNSAIIVTNSKKEVIEEKIKLVSSQMKKYEVPQKLIIVEDPFTVENGFLTQKHSVKRNEIIAYYS